jgi:PhnB protein
MVPWSSVLLRISSMGDRDGFVVDPFGHGWVIASHREDVAPEEMERRLEALMAGG